jgi:hypothetical protein
VAVLVVEQGAGVAVGASALVAHIVLRAACGTHRA